MAESEAPSWLSTPAEDTSAPSNAPSIPATAKIGETSNWANDNGVEVKTSTPSTGLDQNTVDDPSMGRAILLMRLMNVAGAFLLMILAIVTNIGLGIAKPSQFVVAFYVGFGGFLILLQETQLSFLRVRMAMNFGFLFNPPLRFFYYMLLASMCWPLNDFGKGTACVVGALAVYNTYILCKYPEYKERREKIAKEEDSRIKKRIKEQTMKQMLK